MKEEFLNAIAKLCSDFESANDENLIIGCLIQFEDEDGVVYQYNGQKMCKGEAYIKLVDEDEE